MSKAVKAVLLVFFCVHFASAQKQGKVYRNQFIDSVEPLILRGQYPVKYDKLNSIQTFLQDHFPVLKNSHTALVLVTVKEGPLMTHYTFRQTYSGYPVYRSEVRVHLDRNNQIRLVSALLFDCSMSFVSKESFQRIKDRPEASLIKKQEEMVFFNGETAQPVIRYVLTDFSGDESYELLLAEDAKVLYQRDLRLYKSSAGRDSLVPGYIYNPDPLTTAKTYYGSPFIDSNDLPLANLDFQRKPVYINVWFANDSFWLINRYMRFMDFSGPFQGNMGSRSSQYYYSRSEDMFEAFNAFYHISMMQKYAASIGFSGLLDSLHVDPHALNNEDNSYFDFSDSIPTLSYGDGGVDDAEDADVIVHEFTHCMSYYAAAETTNGAQRLAMEEGNADYMAASYSWALDTFRFAEVYTWDGHNQFWDGRNAVNQKTYPNFAGNHHLDGEIWANALVNIMKSLGKSYADSLMFQSLFFQSSNLGMPAMAQTFLLIDSMMSGGIHYKEIYQAFVDKKILAWHVSVKENTHPDAVKLLSSSDFATGKDDAVLSFAEPFTGDIEIYDVQGRLIGSMRMEEESSIKINPGTFAPGLYFIFIRNNNWNKTYKLLRY